MDSLFDEVGPPMRDALRRAYELGYREGIASVPGRRDQAPAEAADIARLATDGEPQDSAKGSRADEPVFMTWEEAESDDDATDDDAEEGGQRRKRRRVGIFASSTVGMLRAKIQKMFRLERFAIDIVIIRAGDKERRQLPSHVRLEAYAVEE